MINTIGRSGTQLQEHPNSHSFAPSVYLFNTTCIIEESNPTFIAR